MLFIYPVFSKCRYCMRTLKSSLSIKAKEGKASFCVTHCARQSIKEAETHKTVNNTFFNCLIFMLKNRMLHPSQFIHLPVISSAISSPVKLKRCYYTRAPACSAFSPALRRYPAKARRQKPRAPYRSAFTPATERLSISAKGQ